MELAIEMHNNGGVLGVHVEQSDWLNSRRLMHLFGITYVNITKSRLLVEEFHSYFCDYCDALSIHGQRDLDPMASDIFGVTFDDFYSPPLYLEGVVFTGTGGLLDQRYLNFSDLEIFLIDTKFVIKESIVFKIGTSQGLVVSNVTVQCASAHVPARVKGVESISYTCTPVCPGDNKYTLCMLVT